MAEALRDRYFVFVVNNFRERPRHDGFRDGEGGGFFYSVAVRDDLAVGWDIGNLAGGGVWFGAGGAFDAPEFRVVIAVAANVEDSCVLRNLGIVMAS